VSPTTSVFTEIGSGPLKSHIVTNLTTPPIHSTSPKTVGPIRGNKGSSNLLFKLISAQVEEFKKKVSILSFQKERIDLMHKTQRIFKIYKGKISRTQFSIF
jgi:hypothetical protein